MRQSTFMTSMETLQNIGCKLKKRELSALFLFADSKRKLFVK